MQSSNEILHYIVKQNIRDGESPSQLLKDIFNTIDNILDTGKKTAVLYCTCFGGFGYSDEFCPFIKNTFNVYTLDAIFEDHIADDMTINHSREIYPYIEAFAQHLNVSIDEALRRASGKYCKLAIKWVPAHRKYRIDEYDGAESVTVLNDFNS